MKVRLEDMRKKMKIYKEGSAAVEFALVLPILVILLFGIIEFGLILYDKAMVTNASREGARFGIVFRTLGTEVTCPDITDIISNKLGCDAGTLTNCNRLISFESATVSTTYDPADCGPAGGEPFTVTVTYPYTYLLLPDFVETLSGEINLVGETRMIKE